ncbi:nitroreductase family protein [Tritrichomonas foetus]|uniref:Nitroreductase family protein n=1 Tax=Tritrichomonas foetus TaxID=1144522 RepID=A0A1J4JL11_9EUKA|nr:nitroreductase family protein [Tritrichomonas foetus]|eukprot:OHS99792.1 nitroreductase family protein [Tritrichomonas foetus]
MNALEALQGRRTVRQYEPDYVIPDSDLEQIVNAGLISPTACNVQDIDLVVVTNRAKLDEVATTALATWPADFQAMFNKRKEELGVKNVVTCDASCLVCLVKNERADPLFTSINNGIVSMSLIVAARALGLETMCVGALLWGDKSKVESLLGIPEGNLVMAVAIGKAKPDHKEQPKEVLCKATYIK